MKSETIGKLAEALAKAQGQMNNAAKDSDNPFFKSKYADLAAVWDACRWPLSSNGLSVAQPITTSDAGVVTVETILMHLSGEWISSSLSIKPVKQDPQGVGSAITYARRFALGALVGVSAADDDGNEASGKVDKNNYNQEYTKSYSDLPPLPLYPVKTVISPQPKIIPGATGTAKAIEQLDSNVKKPLFAKINALKEELGLTAEELKAQVYTLCKQDDATKLTESQLEMVISLLTSEVIARENGPNFNNPVQGSYLK